MQTITIRKVVAQDLDILMDQHLCRMALIPIKHHLPKLGRELLLECLVLKWMLRPKIQPYTKT
jgi:hypothetical protein